ncbi:aminodeoxychorismate synthase, component I [Francisella philomiragia subsp. philomiragia ATCC 25015]|uniref:aminodeoxychorismate synthase component I n=1 Tax=Francisella philomiragia TaxID=28110 RepID=UPI0001AF78E1|nr:aminodeoxychorismate synthase component I [Francisella philomiragia]AJI75792.1 aminodeoxychorismate synthase, component I [Francisella philomiragia subsp. philomiragia ATCC 25015]EET21545.1 chorismate binding family protein [Francisella philomiragia subsp. philomiragia ATCC 25015]MBK2237974.1 aminodeoxychorismate synthase component I [Francisella philomiragia]
MSNTQLPQFAILEDTLTNNQSYYFYNPVAEVIANDNESLELAFGQLEELQQQGLYLVGYLSYEASYYLNNNLYDLCDHDNTKLLHFVAFSNYSNEILKNIISDKNIDLMIDSLNFADYQKSFDEVQQALINGESYQINLTKNILATTKLTSYELYNKLKQQSVKYAAYLPFLNPDIISISPELFFKKDAENLIVNPMKGTARLTGNDSEDQKIYQELSSCDKNRAENLIIVDLLRNDLSAIAKTHTVKVDKLFSIEKYKNLLQMTSQISAKVDKQISFRKILDGLFPCGSITGAPKKRTMELIKQIEKDKRGVYTGSIGYIMPNNDMCFNVAIRTIQKYRDNLQIGVGGGITVYSDAQSEWQEMNTKINFVRQIYQPDFCLIESIYYHNKFRNLELHFDRLEDSARQLFFDIDICKIRDQLYDYVEQLTDDKEYKIRLEYHYDKSINIEHTEINTTDQQAIKLKICPEKINSANKLFQHKTTHSSTRGFYTQMHHKYIHEDNCELIYLNEKDNITETRFHNIIIKKNDKLYTPKLEDGVLAGVARKSLISQGKLQSKSLNFDDLKNADKIYLINSVRGLIPAYLGI